METFLSSSFVLWRAALLFAVLSCSTLAAADSHPIARTPPMGWSSWNRFADKVSDATIRNQAQAMVRNGMKDAGYQYVNLDDGWAGSRDGAGVIHPNSKFPDMAALADYIHRLGLKFGIYTAATRKTCVGLPGSLEYERQDATTYASWGVDYVKVDFCPEQYDWFTGGDEGAQVEFTKIGSALHASGRPMVYSMGAPGASWRWAARAGAHLWRTSIDIKDNWDRMAGIGFSQNGLERFAGPGHWNDPDMLEIGNEGFDNIARDATLVQAPLQRKGMTTEEYRTQMSLWCLLAAPLIVGADLTQISPPALALLTHPEVIAIDQDTLGVQGHRVYEEGPMEVWIKPLGDGSKAVGLFHRELGRVPVTVRWADLGLPSSVAVRDVWARKDLGVYRQRFTVSVPGHGVVLLRVRSVQ